MVESVTKDMVIAFRLRSQHLSGRLSQDRLNDAAGACGIQNSPPGSAGLALHARVDGVSPERLDRAIAEDKELVQTWSMRGAPYCFPTSEAGIFTTGVLPPTEDGRRQLILGVGPSVDKLGLSVTDAVERVRAEVGGVLAGHRLAIDELGKELAAAVAPSLSTAQREIWEQEGPHAAGQPVGEAVVHFCLRILTLEGVVCFAPRDGNKAPFVLVDEWLGGPFASEEPDVARAELLRRYLHCYGPSTRADFAAWLGIRSGDAEPWWSLVEDEMTRVDFGRRTWILTDDLDALMTARTPQGVRLLPPHDPYLQLRDRETIVDKKYHREIWKPVGDPGAVLADGEIIGIWRPRKKGRKLDVTLQTFDAVDNRMEESLRREAERIGPLRGVSTVDVSFSR